MANLPPPNKARHLRLVPPLLQDGAESFAPPAVNALLPQLPVSSTTARWTLAVAGGAALACSWVLMAPYLPRAPRALLQTAATSRARPQGPSFEAYAKSRDTSVLGRPLAEGDVLFADDHLMLGIHNAPAPGLEAAQYAAVFAINAQRHIAALYPPLGADAVAMPLPQVASMALLDGPQIGSSAGPVTLVAVFLRQQLALGPLMAALEAAGPTLALPELDHAVVRLQQVTLAHRGQGPL